MNPPQAEFLDLYRTGLQNAAGIMKASLESAERLQHEQLTAIRGALETQWKAMGELTDARSIDQLMALQQQLAGAQFERVMGYWSNLCQLAGQNQVAAITQAQAQMAQARDWFNETYSLTARATEEAAKIASAQMATVSAGARQQQAAKQQEGRRASA